MQITREDIDSLNAILAIHVEEADYAEAVDKSIRNLKQKVNVPGFRPGMVPTGMIKKMYGRQVLSEEVGRITVDNLYKYLEEQHIDFLGNPLPNLERNQIDWDNQKEFTFYYDLGLAPQFQVTIPHDETFRHLKVEVEGAVLADELERLRRRYGRSMNAESVEEKDLVAGQITELGEDGQPKEGGLDKQTYIILDKIEDESVRQKFLGAKVGDEIVFDPRTAYKDEVTASIYLGVKPEEVKDLSGQFRMAISTITRLVPSDMNQEFFDKVFGEGQVGSEEEFTERIRQLLASDMQGESNAKLFNEIRKSILAHTRFELPDAFLKRWIKVKNSEEKDFNPERVDEEYDSGRDVIRWELIRKKIVNDQQIQITNEEMMGEARRTVVNRLNQMGYSLPEERVDEAARRLLGSEQEAEKIVNFLYEIKALEYLKTQVTIQEESIGYEAFTRQLESQSEVQPA